MMSLDPSIALWGTERSPCASHDPHSQVSPETSFTGTGLCASSQVPGRLSMLGQGVRLSCMLLPENFLILLPRLCPGSLRGHLMWMELQGCGQHCVKLCLEQKVEGWVKMLPAGTKLPHRKIAWDPKVEWGGAGESWAEQHCGWQEQWGCREVGGGGHKDMNILS